jgi:AhpD family alkylhydroperoxidase
MPRLETFRRERERLNARVLERATLETRRFFSLDGQCYRDGALPARTKELLGLVASLVLRCDDCVAYHLIRCAEEGVGDEEMMEALNVGLVVGGSIVIPHLRRAVDFLDEIRAEQAGGGAKPRSSEPRPGAPRPTKGRRAPSPHPRLG